MTVLIDTNILIDALNGRHGRREFLNDLAAQGHELASCAITVAEVYAGMRPNEARKTEAWLAETEYIETRQSTAKLGGELKYNWARKGHTLFLVDTLIAAVAIENDIYLATDNVKDFPMPELRLLTPTRLH
ncbi:MAG: type II toxin-antitoxin system VapC family toxin [Bryobacteraceae bacterium]